MHFDMVAVIIIFALGVASWVYGEVKQGERLIAMERQIDDLANRERIRQEIEANKKATT